MITSTLNSPLIRMQMPMLTTASVNSSHSQPHRPHIDGKVHPAMQYSHCRGY